MRNLSRFVVLLPAMALLVGAWLSWPLVAEWHGDLVIYAGYADQVMRGLLPYRDFTLEYPPLALVPFVLPRLLSLGTSLDATQYRAVFLLQAALLVWLITLVSQQLAPPERRTRLVLILALFVAVLSPFLAWRFDLFPAVLTGFALLAAAHNRWAIAGVWLGFGVAAKLYPVVLEPMFALGACATAYGEPGWPALAARRVLWLSLGTAAALAATVLPFAVIAPDGLLDFLAYHQQRGVQIESVAGGIVSLGALAGLTSSTGEFTYGAFHLVSPWADALLPWLTPLLVGLYLLLFVVGLQQLAGAGRLAGQQIGGWLLVMTCAALLLFIATNKVFSPQYLVWLLPFLPLLRRAQMLLSLFICVATVAIFPFGYAAMLATEPWAVVLLNLRNLATVALLIWLAAGQFWPAADVARHSAGSRAWFDHGTSYER